MSAAGLKPGSQCARVLEVLSDGQPHTMREVHARAGFMRLNSRVSELRSRSFAIECWRDGGDYVYQLLARPESPRVPPLGSGRASVSPAPPEAPNPEPATKPVGRGAGSAHLGIRDDGSGDAGEQLTLGVAA